MTREYKRLFKYFSNLETGRLPESMKGSRFEKAFNKIYQAYEANEKTILNGLRNGDIMVEDPRKAFMQQVFARMKENIGTVKKPRHLGADKAIKKELRSETFLSAEERGAQNAIKALRGDRSAYDVWRKYIRHQKIDYSNFSYMADENTYVYSFGGWNIYIKILNSPTEVKIWREKKNG